MRMISAAIAAVDAASLLARPQLWPEGAAPALRAILAALLLGALLCAVHALGLRPERRPLARLTRPPLAWLIALAGISGLAVHELMQDA